MNKCFYFEHLFRLDYVSNLLKLSNWKSLKNISYVSVCHGEPMVTVSQLTIRALATDAAGNGGCMRG